MSGGGMSGGGMNYAASAVSFSGTFVGWPGDGQAATGSFDSTSGSGTYNGTGSQAITWAGFGGGWG